MRDYLVRSSTPDPVMSMLAERTGSVGDAAGMMVPVEQAALLTMLTALVSATTAVDIGTFTGLSALALARGVRPGGRVITCDVTDKWSDIARSTGSARAWRTGSTSGSGQRCGRCVSWPTPGCRAGAPQHCAPSTPTSPPTTGWTW